MLKKFTACLMLENIGGNEYEASPLGRGNECVGRRRILRRPEV